MLYYSWTVTVGLSFNQTELWEDTYKRKPVDSQMKIWQSIFDELKENSSTMLMLWEKINNARGKLENNFHVLPGDANDRLETCQLEWWKKRKTVKVI